MHIQGRKLKRDKEPQKGVLNEFTDSRIITFMEREVGDVVDARFRLNQNEKGYFAEEYRPDTIARADAKAVDITAFIINEQDSVCRWWLYDVKKDVGGRDVIVHLCEQWRAAYSYLENSVLNFLLDESIETKGNIGVITRKFDAGRIRTELEKLDESIKELEKDIKQTVMLAKRKAGVQLPVLRLTRDLLKNILDKKVSFRCAGKDMEFTFDVRISTERADEEYYYLLICDCSL